MGTKKSGQKRANSNGLAREGSLLRFSFISPSLIPVYRNIPFYRCYNYEARGSLLVRVILYCNFIHKYFLPMLQVVLLVETGSRSEKIGEAQGQQSRLQILKLRNGYFSAITRYPINVLVHRNFNADSTLALILVRYRRTLFVSYSLYSSLGSASGANFLKRSPGLRPCHVTSRFITRHFLRVNSTALATLPFRPLTRSDRVIGFTNHSV